MIWLQDEQGLMCVPDEMVATFTPEYRERWRVVLMDGTVGYRTTPPPPGPWVKHGDSWVLPGALKEGVDPAGFVYAG